MHASADTTKSEFFMIDVFMIVGCRRYLHVPTGQRWKSAETEMVKQLKARIRLAGPLTVADYMKEVLTNPSAVGGLCDNLLH